MAGRESDLQGAVFRAGIWPAFWKRPFQDAGDEGSTDLLWRTADGAEIDLVIERGSARVAVEIKAGRGDKLHAARVLERAMGDVGEITRDLWTAGASAASV